MTLSFQLLKKSLLSVTKEIPPLNRLHTDISPENSHSDISPEFIIKEEEVYHKLSSISTSKSPGPDGIPNWVLKSYAHVLASPVASIFNASIQQPFSIRPFRPSGKKLMSFQFQKYHHLRTLPKTFAPFHLHLHCLKSANVLLLIGYSSI